MIRVHNGNNVRAQAEELGIQSPESFVILPQNYFSAESVDELRLNQETLTIEKLVEKEGFEPDQIVDFSDYPVAHRWSAEIIGPLIHFTAEFLIENWAGVLTIISIIKTHYLLQRESSIQFEFSVERSDGTHKQIIYEGDPEQLDQVTDLLEEEKRNARKNDSDIEATEDDGEETGTTPDDEEELEST